MQGMCPGGDFSGTFFFHAKSGFDIAVDGKGE
jgi:hypothetical protein